MGVGAMEERKEERKVGWEKRFGGTEGTLAVGRWGRESVLGMEREWMEMVRDKLPEAADVDHKIGEEDIAEKEKEKETETETATEKGDEVMSGV